MEQRQRVVVLFCAAIVTLVLVSLLLSLHLTQFSFVSLRDELVLESLVVLPAQVKSTITEQPVEPAKQEYTGSLHDDFQATTAKQVKPSSPRTSAVPFSCDETTMPRNSGSNQQQQQQQQGLIIVSLLGRMGNNLFQVAVANRLAAQLCWPVVFRPSWQGPLAHDMRMRQCFPNAWQYATATDWNHVPANVQHVLKNVSSQWPDLQKQRSNQLLDAMRSRVQEATQPTDKWWYDLDDNSASDGDKGSFLDALVQSIQNGTLPTRVLHVRGFFIHYDYVQGWLPQMRSWAAVGSSCCQTVPVHPDTILLHWRDFNQKDGRQFSTPDTDWVQIYLDLIRKLQTNDDNNQQRPLLILTQPSSVNTAAVQALANHTNATIQTGVDVPDAMCLLQQHASTVLLSYASTFSQGPVLFGSNVNDNKDVHYPLVKLQKPQVTVRVPFWHYHLVGKNGIERSDVPVQEIQLP